MRLKKKLIFDEKNGKFFVNKKSINKVLENSDRHSQDNVNVHIWLKFQVKKMKIVRVMLRAILKNDVSRKTRLKFFFLFAFPPEKLKKGVKNFFYR